MRLQRPVILGGILFVALLSAVALTRVQVLQEPSSADPWAALPSRTGWLLLGFLASDSDRWESDPSFSFVLDEKTAPEASATKAIPKKGDQIRLLSPQPLVILDFKHSGEKKLSDSPAHALRVTRTDDFTGVVLPEHSKVVVKDVSTTPLKEFRQVWAQVSPLGQ